MTPPIAPPRRLPWDCGCHEIAVFGHLEPCVLWQTQPKPWDNHRDGYT